MHASGDGRRGGLWAPSVLLARLRCPGLGLASANRRFPEVSFARQRRGRRQQPLTGSHVRSVIGQPGSVGGDHPRRSVTSSDTGACRRYGRLRWIEEPQ